MAWRGPLAAAGSPPAGAQAATVGSCRLAPFVWDSVAGVGLPTRLGISGGAQPAAWQWEAWRPCVPHPHSSQIQLVFGESSDRGQSKGKKKLWTSFGQRTKDWHPQSEVTSFGPHNPWVGEPFWMLDHLIPRAPCFLSRAGARKK